MNNQFVIAVVLVGAFVASIYFNEAEKSRIVDNLAAAEAAKIEIPHDSNKKTDTYFVKLDGSNSFDNENDSLSYSWAQVEGSDDMEFVQLYHPNEAFTYFEAKEGVYTFKLTVTDSYGASADTLITFVIQHEPNKTPVPEIIVSGKDSEYGQRIADVFEINYDDVEEEEFTVEHDNNPKTKTYRVQLDAGQSSDEDDTSIKQYSWIQIDGHEKVELSDPDKAKTHFTATAGIYTFRLTVTDAYGAKGHALQVVSIGPEPNVNPIASISVSEYIEPKPTGPSAADRRRRAERKAQQDAKKKLLKAIGG
jgi:PKD repeat protein|tara:strand:- start:2785 stop:3705 length:921 start_codon:yes stop_codon:yes gene_type:complete